jgi:hypothetical protein
VKLIFRWLYRQSASDESRLTLAVLYGLIELGGWRELMRIIISEAVKKYGRRTKSERKNIVS